MARARLQGVQHGLNRAGVLSFELWHDARTIERVESKGMDELLARDILVDYRPKAGIRLSPHFYDRDEEIDFALGQIEEILAPRPPQAGHLQTV